jgi:hypothetical protein
VRRQVAYESSTVALNRRPALDLAMTAGVSSINAGASSDDAADSSAFDIPAFLRRQN